MKYITPILVALLLFSTSIIAQNYESYKKALDTTIMSNSLGFEKKFSVILPFEWQEDIDTKFPVIVIFDKQNQRSNNYIINNIDYLTSNDQMPSSIIISVESEQNYRALETLHKATSDKGLAKENESFIFDELFPFAEKHLKASDYRILIGHSRYGYFTTSLLYSRLNEINAVISLSPFFKQKNVDLTDSIPQLENEKLSSTKYYRFGIGNDYPEQYKRMDSVLQTFKHPQLDIKGVLHPEAGHNVTPGLSIASSLYDIFEKWAELQNHYFANDFDQLNTFPEIKNKVKSHYGNELKFSLGVLNGKGWHFYNEEKYEKAIEAWEIQLEYYPNFAITHLFILDAKKMVNKDLPKEEIEDILEKFRTSLERSVFYTKEEKEEIIKNAEKEFM